MSLHVCWSSCFIMILKSPISTKIFWIFCDWKWSIDHQLLMFNCLFLPSFLCFPFLCFGSLLLSAHMFIIVISSLTLIMKHSLGLVKFCFKVYFIWYWYIYSNPLVVCLHGIYFFIILLSSYFIFGSKMYVL